MGDRAHAKSVNHSIWKMNGMFWSSLPFVSGEWPVQRQAQQAGAEVSADVDGYRGIMMRRPGAWPCSVHPVHPAVKGPAAEHSYMSVLVLSLSYTLRLKCCGESGQGFKSSATFIFSFFSQHYVGLFNCSLRTTRRKNLP